MREDSHVRRRPRVYLAGPDVFLANSAEIGAAKRRICWEHGLEGVYPGDGPYERLAGLGPVEAGLVCFDICVELMDSCDLAIANMTPFRGPSMDVGTAVEIGYLYARGKAVYGYTNTPGTYSSRVPPDGAFIEPFDLCDILMAPGAVARSTGELPHEPASQHTGEGVGALGVFTECVGRIAQRMQTDVDG